MTNATTLVRQHQEQRARSGTNDRHTEETYGHEVLEVVLQEPSPVCERGFRLRTK